MKKLLLSLIVITAAGSAFAGTKAPVAPVGSSLVDSSGHAVTTQHNSPVALASEKAAPAVEPKIVPSKKPHGSKPRKQPVKAKPAETH